MVQRTVLLEMIVEAKPPDPEFEQRANTLLSQWRKGDLTFIEAIDQYNALKYEAMQAGNLSNEALVERLLGIVRITKGHYDHAIRHFRTARDIHEQLGNSEHLLLCENNMGEVYRLKGEYDRAHRILQITHESARKQNMLRPLIFSLCNDGRTLVNMGQYADSLPLLEEAVQLAQDPTLRPEIIGLISLIHADFGMAYVGLGQYPEAFESAKMAIQIGIESNEVRRQAQAHRLMGHVLTFYAPITDLLIDPDLYFEKSIALCRETRLDLDIALILWFYGESLAIRRRYDEARAKLQEALLIYERLDILYDVNKIKAVLANLPQ
jgi:tetratricopeptide (TPR) repeat protein